MQKIIVIGLMCITAFSEATSGYGSYHEALYIKHLRINHHGLLVCPKYAYGGNSRYGHYVDPGNCGKFYHCAPGASWQKYGISHHKICPGELVFDPFSDRCEWYRNYPCEIFRRGSYYFYAIVAKTVCPSYKPGLYPDYKRCDQYIECINSRDAYVKRCPHGEGWNPYKYQCQPGYLCSGGHGGQGTGNPKKGLNYYLCPGVPDGPHAHKYNPNLWVHASNEYCYIKPCPGQTVWNDKIKTCAWKQY